MGAAIAITGATGYLGQLAVPYWLAAGHSLRAWRRSPRQTVHLPWADAVEWIDGGLDDARGDTALVKGADALVHLAFTHVPGRYRGGEGDDVAGFYRRNLDGTRRLIAAARQADVPRFGFLSSRAVYGGRLTDRPLDERHPTVPDSHYGALKAAVEAELAAFAAVDGWHTVSLRCTGVYGRVAPRQRTKWAAVIDDMTHGRRHDLVRGGTEVHGEDVAQALSLLLDAPAARGRPFVCSDVFVTTRAVARLCAPDRPDLWPAPPPPPSGVLQCRNLLDLGWRPRGWRGVVDCVTAMVEFGWPPTQTGSAQPT